MLTLSMADVRSAVLARAQTDIATQTVVLTCPEGLTILIKRILLWNDAQSQTAVNVWMRNPASGIYAFILHNSLEVSMVDDYETWQVMLPGDDLLWSTSSGGVHMWISGAVLYGTPVGFTPGLSVTGAQA